MTALKAKWGKMTYYQRILLILMVLEIAVFGVITAVSVNRLGIAYGDSLLFPRTEGTLQIYEGEVDGGAACFTVSPGREVSYQWGGLPVWPLSDLRGSLCCPRNFLRRHRRGDPAGGGGALPGCLFPRCQPPPHRRERGAGVGIHLLRHYKQWR